MCKLNLPIGEALCRGFAPTTGCEHPSMAEYALFAAEIVFVQMFVELSRPTWSKSLATGKSAALSTSSFLCLAPTPFPAFHAQDKNISSVTVQHKSPPPPSRSINTPKQHRDHTEHSLNAGRLANITPRYLTGASMPCLWPPVR